MRTGSRRSTSALETIIAPNRSSLAGTSPNGTQHVDTSPHIALSSLASQMMLWRCSATRTRHTSSRLRGGSCGTWM